MYAAEAVDLFVYRMGRELGSLAALVFTAGIGEHAAEIRHRVCACGMARDRARSNGKRAQRNAVRSIKFLFRFRPKP